MVTLSLSDDQVIELVKQIPYEKQRILFQFLLEQQQQRWHELSLEGQAGVRIAAIDRGQDWDKMSEEQQEDFINDLV